MRPFGSLKGILISCLLILVIPPLVSMHVIGRYIEDDFQAELYRSNQSRLETAAKLYRQFTNNYIYECVRLTADDKLAQLSRMPHYKQLYESADSAIMTTSFLMHLARVAETSEMIHSIYVYIDGADYILYSNLGVSRMDDFFDQGWQNNYQRFTDGREKSVWYSRALIDPSGTERRVVTTFWRMSYYLPYMEGGIIINLDEGALCDMLNSGGRREGSVAYVLDSSGTVVSHPEKEKIGGMLDDQRILSKLQSSMAREGYLTDGSGGSSVLVSYSRDMVNGWVIVSETSIGFLKERISALNMMIPLASMILLVCCGFVWMISRKRLYNPVRQMVRDLKTHKGIDIDAIQEKNELLLVKNAFTSLIHEEEALFNKGTRKHLGEALRILLSGEIDNIAELGYISGEEVCIVEIQVDNFQDFCQQHPSEKRHYIYMLIIEIANQIFHNGLNGTVLDDERIVLLFQELNIPDESALDLGMEKLRCQLKQITSFTFSAGAGGRGRDIATALKQAEIAINEAYFHNNGQTHFYKNASHTQTRSLYPFYEERSILSQLDQQEGDLIEKLADAFVDAVAVQDDISRESAAYCFAQLVGAVVSSLESKGVSPYGIYGRNPVCEVFECQSITHVRETLKWVLSVAMYDLKRINTQPTHFIRIKEYVDTHFREDIDINKVSETAKLSYSYVRKLFQDHMNTGIVDYINTLRIREAKHLLDTTNLTGKQIGQAVGYNSEQNFNRVFKKLVDMTPGAYRNRNHERGRAESRDNSSSSIGE